MEFWSDEVRRDPCRLARSLPHKSLWAMSSGRIPIGRSGRCRCRCRCRTALQTRTEPESVHRSRSRCRCRCRRRGRIRHRLRHRPRLRKSASPSIPDEGRGRGGPDIDYDIDYDIDVPWAEVRASDPLPSETCGARTGFARQGSQFCIPYPRATPGTQQREGQRVWGVSSALWQPIRAAIPGGMMSGSLL